jgi:hypothetical protein
VFLVPRRIWIIPEGIFVANGSIRAMDYDLSPFPSRNFAGGIFCLSLSVMH